MMFQDIGMKIDIGGHNAVGAVFLMFIAVNAFGALLIKSIYESNNKEK